MRTGAQDRVVLALGDGRFKSIAVRLGRVDEHHAEIRAGLGVADAVVVSAQFLLDSESSKSSDFTRLHHGDPDAGAAGGVDHGSQHHQHPGDVDD